MLIFSNTDLPEQEFNAQREKIRRVASYDSDTRSWYSQIPLDRPERAAEMLREFLAAKVGEKDGQPVWLDTSFASEDQNRIDR